MHALNQILRVKSEAFAHWADDYLLTTISRTRRRHSVGSEARLMKGPGKPMTMAEHKLLIELLSFAVETGTVVGLGLFMAFALV
jgi:hypothetical protein